MSALAPIRAAAGKLEQWASVNAIAAVEGCTPRAIRLRAQKECWKSRPGQKGNNGRLTREYLPPAQIQLKLLNAKLSLVAKPSEGPAPQHRLLSDSMHTSALNTTSARKPSR